MLTCGVNMNTLSLNSRLVGVYASSGDLKSADSMLQKTRNPNIFAMNWMISAMAFNGFYEQAIGYFSLLLESRKIPNNYTFSFVLKACVGLMDVKKGKEVHAVVNKLGFELDLSLVNRLIDMYSKCGNLGYARKVFDEMPQRDVASWTSMICGYFSVGKVEESLALFERMRLEGVEPNEFTWNAMLAGLARAGDCDGAFTFFSRMSSEGLVPDLVTWNAIISGFVQSKRTTEALKLFGDMLIAGIRPNEVTVTALLPVCGLMDSIQKGKEIHSLIYRMGLCINVFIGSALIDMYSKCVSVKDAWNVFERIRFKNVSSFNAMIGCCGKHGMFDSAIHLFERMQEEEIRPNQVTLVCVLSACSHGGLVEKGLMIFRYMKERYGVEATNEHYACLVDLLCRSGRMEEAYTFLKEMPFEFTDSIIGAFFNGCKLHERRDMAKKMAEDFLRMGLKRPGGFVILSNIYAAKGEWKEVENVRNVMKDMGVYKKPGSSWFEKRDEFSEVELGKGKTVIEIGGGTY